MSEDRTAVHQLLAHAVQLLAHAQALLDAPRRIQPELRTRQGGARATARPSGYRRSSPAAAPPTASVVRACDDCAGEYRTTKPDLFTVCRACWRLRQEAAGTSPAKPDAATPF
jgi:hypothetical protein